jgi:Hypervirulence associated proteins TUDOR domain
MAKMLKRGDHVEWNSEAGRVRGVIMKRVISDVRFKGYTHHATREEPQYFIKSDKTDHIAIHKGAALRLLRARPGKKRKKSTNKRAKEL